jgi:PTS system nitrogen regulatory IIA component
LIEKIKEPFLALAIIREGVDFGSADEKPTYVLMLLLGNKNNPGVQLKILAHVCRLVKETDVIEKLKKIEDPEGICTLLKQEEEKII